ncbi:GNAT family N-acetyltransferase [Candidatus Nomurabacteria bacterium]|nr:GNAT family N-acetyltransferase [Candidatus Nomurabacteria bacterium]
MIYKIINAENANWKKFKEIRLEALRTDEKAYGVSYDEEVLKPDSRWQEGLARKEKPLFFIELENGEYIGMAGAKPIDEEGAYMLIAVYLKENYRGRGLAKELIEFVEDFLQKQRVQKLDLMVNKEQLQAVNFYKKIGYKVIKEIKDQKMGDGKLYDEFYMSKLLN